MNLLDSVLWKWRSLYLWQISQNYTQLHSS